MAGDTVDDDCESDDCCEQADEDGCSTAAPATDDDSALADSDFEARVVPPWDVGLNDEAVESWNAAEKALVGWKATTSA